MLPGICTWTTFVLAIVLSYYQPIWVAFFIILFDFYWLFKAVNIGTHLMFSHRKIRLHERRDWLSRLHALSDLPSLIRRLEEEQAEVKSRFERADIEEDIAYLRKRLKEALSIDFRRILHVIMLPTVHEPIEVLEASIESYLAADYPHDRIILMLACEERAGEEARKKAAMLSEKYASRFLQFRVSFHPDGIEGEARTKGANITHAARLATSIVDGMKIAYKDVIVSAFDADTIIKPNYFAQLTYTYLTTDAPTRASYQPVPFYNNNVWDAPAFNRLVAINSSFWQMVESSRSDRLVTFSSHSMSLQALVEVDYWPVDVISEDSQIFWRCFLYHHGSYRTQPLFTSVSLDAVVLGGYLPSLVGQYKQNRRWAWGIVDFPYVVTGFIRDREILLWKKIIYAARLFEGHYFWATAAINIAALGWLPLFLGAGRFDNQVFAANLPRVTGNIMTASTLFLILSMVLYFILLPKRPTHTSKLQTASMILQWVLMPVSSIFFGALPAIDAQTRLMLGKYMEFWVTPKVRKTAALASSEPPALKTVL